MRNAQRVRTPSESELDPPAIARPTWSMQTEGLQRFVRQDRLKLAGFSFLTGFGPLLLAAGLLLIFPFSVWLLLGAGVALCLAGRALPGTLKFVDIIETQGTTVRFRRLWTRRWVKVSQPMTTRIDLWLAGKEAAEPGSGRNARVSPQAYLILFNNGKRLFVAFSAFPGAQAVVALLAAHPETGLRFPSRMHGLYLSNMTVYPVPGLGRSWSYYDENEEGNHAVTCYLYHKDLGSIPQGISPLVQTEFGEAKSDILKAGQIRPPPGVATHVADSLVQAGVDPKLEFLSAEYQVTAANETRVSRLFITGYANHFLKIRVTANAANTSYAALCERVLGAIAELAGNRSAAEGPLLARAPLP